MWAWQWLSWDQTILLPEASWLLLAYKFQELIFVPVSSPCIWTRFKNLEIQRGSGFLLCPHLSLLSHLPDKDDNHCFTGSLDQIQVKEASLPLESRDQKEMNVSISVSFRHIKAHYYWENLWGILVESKK